MHLTTWQASTHKQAASCELGNKPVHKLRLASWELGAGQLERI